MFGYDWCVPANNILKGALREQLDVRGRKSPCVCISPPPNLISDYHILIFNQHKNDILHVVSASTTNAYRKYARNKYVQTNRSWTNDLTLTHHIVICVCLCVLLCALVEHNSIDTHARHTSAKIKARPTVSGRLRSSGPTEKKAAPRRCNSITI